MLPGCFSVDNGEVFSLRRFGQDKIVTRSKVLQDFVIAGQSSIENK